MTPTVTITDIERAREIVADAILRTPLVPAPRLSARTGSDVWLKLENLQHTGSFKVRGAGYKMARLGSEAKKRGVIAASAGNHAQGVAFHAERLGIPAVIVMPEATPFTKVTQTARYGAKIVFKGHHVMEAEAEARRLADSHGYLLIHPFDDPDIIAGQGTLALEVIEDAPGFDVLIVPVGGGGLIAGCAVAAAARAPALEVIGVEVAAYPSMRNALKGDGPVQGGATLAEGIAVTTAGALAETIVRALVRDVVTVSEIAIESAVEDLLLAEKTLAEGAGAAPLAALLEHSSRFRGKRVVLIVSGGNIDSRILSTILLRGLFRAGRMVRLRVEILDQPGILSRVSGLIAARGGNIIEVYHQRLFHDVPIKTADLDLVVETRGAEHGQEIVAAIRDAGFPVEVLHG